MESYEGKFKGKNILITGGLGFIGSNLAGKLSKLEPKKITLVDSFIEGLGANLENVRDIRDCVEIPDENHGGVDISNKEVMTKLLPNVDYLFNLAGSVSHLNSKNRPLNDLELNLASHVSLLESCRESTKGRNSRLKVLFSATRDVYGKVKAEDLPIREDFFIREQADPQGIHKQAAEFHHLWYAANFGFDSTVLRLTNTYGPRQKIDDPNLGFLGYFIHQALKDETINLWGGGESLRDFNHVDDVVDAMLMTMTSEKTNGNVYNLGSFMKIGGRFKDIGDNIRTVGETAKVITKIAESGKCKEIPYPEDRKAIEPGHV